MIPTSKKENAQTTIQISGKELHNIMEQFKPDPLRDDESIYKYKQAINKLNKSDKIIFALYAELASERAVAELLGVSRSPIHKLLVKIREQILMYTNDDN